VSGSPWAIDGTVEVTVADGVATVTLARPPGNAWTPALGQRFFAALEKLAVDPGARALVITGDGPDFCVGADGGSLDNIADDGGYEISAARPTYWMAVTIGKPLIAAVNGACFGVGMQIALLWLLPRLVGLGVANDLLLSGRLVRAPEALQLGLVNRVVDGELLEAATDYARQLAASCSPAAMAVIKRQTYVDLTSTLPSAVARGDMYMEAAMASEDFAEGVRSWREKRPPAFPPLDPALARFPIPGDDQLSG